MIEITESAVMSDESRAAEEWNRQALRLVRDAAGPGLLETHAADGSQDVDPARRQPDLHHLVRPSEVCARDAHRRKRSAEREEGRKGPLGVPGIGADPDVQVACRARNPVNGHGVRPDDEEPDAGLEERREQIPKVAVHAPPATRQGRQLTGVASRV